jgi:hypothetical protein
MKKYPKLKTLETKDQWLTVLCHLKSSARGSILGRSQLSKEERKAECKARKQVWNALGKIRTAFGLAKNQLRRNGLVCKRRMPWKDFLADIPEIRRTVYVPEQLVGEYLKFTGRDPRRLIPDIVRRMF